MQFFSVAKPHRIQGCGLLFMSVLALTAVERPAWSEDSVERLTRELDASRSFKVRIQAANILASLQDVRVAPALAKALAGDRDELVRVSMTRLLSANPGGDPKAMIAREALERATQDRSAKVRKAAKTALLVLERNAPRPKVAPMAATPAAALPPSQRSALPKTMKIAVGQFSDRSGQASPLLRDQVRRNVMQQLTTQGRVVVVDRMESDVSYVVEGSIKRLSLAALPGDMEATCAVDLVLSRPARGILLVASGEASVQRLKVGYKPQQRAAMEQEAMVHAVRSAHDSLAQFLARQ